MEEHFNIKVTGEVQGVFFRIAIQQKAQGLDIGGFVRNESDGSVYIEVEAGESVLNEFIKWLGNGTHNAKIKKIEKSISVMKNFTNFGIKHD